MTFEEVLDQALAMLQRRRRVAYRTFKVQFELDDERLEALKDELLFAHPHIVDEDGRGLVWRGEMAAPASAPPAAAERRQLTVMFCDLVGSTALSAAKKGTDLFSDCSTCCPTRRPGGPPYGRPLSGVVRLLVNFVCGEKLSCTLQSAVYNESCWVHLSP